MSKFSRLILKLSFVVALAVITLQTKAQEFNSEMLTSGSSVLKQLSQRSGGSLKSASANSTSTKESSANHLSMSDNDLNSETYALDSMVWMFKDYKTNEWEKDQKRIYVRDDKGSTTTIFFEDNMFGDGIKLDFVYNEEGNEAEANFSRLYGDQWVVIEKHLYSYDAKNNETGELMQMWFPKSAEDIGRMYMSRDSNAYVYNENKQILEKSRFLYYGKNAGWKVYNKDVYTLTESGKISESVHWLSKYDGGPLILLCKSDYEYYQNQNKEGYVFYSYDESSQTMKRSSKGETYFNDNGKVLEDVYYNYDSESGAWIESYKESNTYNKDGLLVLNQLSNWNKETNEWEVNWQKMYYYSSNIERLSTLTNSGAKDTGSLILFPNPTAGSVTIQSKQIVGQPFMVKVLDMNGKMVYQKNYAKNDMDSYSLTLPKLKNGVYMFQISGEGFNQSSRFIYKGI